jgi:hypothetical protein
MKRLDRDPLLEVAVNALVNGAHPAAAHHPQDLVPAELGAGRERIGRVR